MRIWSKCDNFINKVPVSLVLAGIRDICIFSTGALWGPKFMSFTDMGHEQT